MVEWDAQDRLINERALREQFSEAIAVLATIDRDGHELLLGAGDDVGEGHEPLVGLALFRRSLAQFTGLRRLAGLAMPQQATLLARAHFETSAALRYLVYGGARSPSFFTKSHPRGRLRRANYYWAEDLRRQIYRRYAMLDGRISGHRPIGKRARQGVEDEIHDLTRALKRDFPVQHENFGPIRARRPRKKPIYHDAQPWYSFGFRQRRVYNLRSLCEAFGWTMAYEFLYDAYSGWQHPRGLWHDCSIEAEYIDVHSPYIIDSFETVVGFATRFQLMNHMAFAKAYRPAFIPRLQRTSMTAQPAISALRPTLPPGFA